MPHTAGYQSVMIYTEYQSVRHRPVTPADADTTNRALIDQCRSGILNKKGSQ